MKLIYKKVMLATVVGALTACSNSNLTLTEVNHKWCPSEKASVVEQVQREKVNLAADALFKFGRHKKEDLLEKGRLSLNDLAQKINSGYVHIDRISLTGHTDRLGSEKANYRLGLNRAETIKAYLQKFGVAAPISVVSAGESQPVTTNCIGNKVTKALTECLQPDRRVVLEITGVQKEK